MTGAPLPLCMVGDPVLREQAREVSPDELRSPAVQQLIDDMIETMRAGNPWNAIFSPAACIHRASRSSSGSSSRTARSVAAMSASSPDRATHRNGPLPSQNSGRM